METCEKCGFEAASPRGLARHMTMTHGSPGSAHRRQEPSERVDDAEYLPPEGTVEDDEPEPEQPLVIDARAEEAVPTEPKRRSLREWMRGKQSDARTAKRARKRFKQTGPRQPLDEPLSWTYRRLGGFIGHAQPTYAPVGRVMEMQAPTIGVMIDKAMEGTLPDRILQPFVAEGRRWKQVGEAVALPIMTAMICKKPSLLGLRIETDPTGMQSVSLNGPLATEYYSAWESNAVEMAHGFERTEQRRRDVSEELRKIPFLKPVIEAGGDPVLWLMAQTLPQEEPAPQPVP